MIQIHVRFSFNGVCTGIIRGSGRQMVGVAVNFISYCCCGLPLGIALLFLVFHNITGTKHECGFFLHLSKSAVNALLTDVSLSQT